MIRQERTSFLLKLGKMNRENKKVRSPAFQKKEQATP